MPFTKTWTDEQRDAVIAAVLEHGLTNRQAAERAARGTLPGVGGALDPYPIPHGTVADYCREERRRREAVERATGDPAAVLHEGIGQLSRTFAKEADRISRDGRASMDEVKACAAAGREVLALQLALERAKNPKRGGGSSPPGDSGSGETNGAAPDFIGALAGGKG